ncbi:uncharacterized protein LOC102721465 [Oryza brachyantha]|uniref:uncharacterized protein LOC102721465 n=1 Tax=Oryza brachyantha TaxID=4533 RepID=UPI001ADC31DA|nr:uncharacterized protein LOC102721465 [Oryza brachyantha]
MAAAPPELMDELVAEILLRLPPDDPSLAVRASVVCKQWYHLLTDRGFLRRYRAFHRRPPMLGFIRHHLPDHDGSHPCIARFRRFVPTTAFRPADPHHCNWWPVDCRHGRALFFSNAVELTVWDPMTGDTWRLHEPCITYTYSTAAVLCAVAGCDHGDCHGGPFVVVFVGTDDRKEIAWACAFSSETGEWTTSAPCTVHFEEYIDSKPSVLVGDAVYFLGGSGNSILRYDVGAPGLSVIPPPPAHENGNVLLTTAEDGALGLVGSGVGSTLHLWSRDDDDDEGVAAAGGGWVKRGVIELQDTVLPLLVPLPPQLIGFAEDTDVVFLHTDDGDYGIELNSLRVTKLCGSGNLSNFFPYLSFYCPATVPLLRVI